MKLDFQVTHDAVEFEKSDAIKINYSDENIKGVQVQPGELLKESDIKKLDLKKGNWDDLPVIFRNENNLIPFDIFSAIFYLLSRYEEYVLSERDRHGRFLSDNSILVKLNILHRPIVDLWCEKFHSILTNKPGLNRNYNFISTIDVDNAYAYNHKSFPIKVAGSGKALITRDVEDLKRRFNSYFRRKKDPYDTYGFIDEVHRENNVNSMFFFLLSDRNEWDKNLRYTNKYLRGLVRTLRQRNAVGIHPGYTSSLNASVILEEKLRLEDILSEKVTCSRQHFLKFTFPETPRNLLEAGLEEDFSLGYAERIGFRAGTCTSFKFYDLQKEEPKDLVFHSTALMDATLNRYMGLSPEKAVKMAVSVIKEVKAVKGELITIWHNETLSDIREWKGWRPVFEEVISQAKLEKIGLD